MSSKMMHKSNINFFNADYNPVSSFRSSRKMAPVNFIKNDYTKMVNTAYVGGKGRRSQQKYQNDLCPYGTDTNAT